MRKEGKEEKNKKFNKEQGHQEDAIKKTWYNICVIYIIS